MTHWFSVTHKNTFKRRHSWLGESLLKNKVEELHKIRKEKKDFCQSEGWTSFSLRSMDNENPVYLKHLNIMVHYWEILYTVHTDFLYRLSSSCSNERFVLDPYWSTALWEIQIKTVFWIFWQNSQNKIPSEASLIMTMRMVVIFAWT